MKRHIIRVQNLKKHFFIKDKTLKVLDDISFEIETGKTLAIVGESGCGKSTIANILASLIKPTSGDIFFENSLINQTGKGLIDKDLTDQDLKKNISMIFQDPYLSLNPKMRIEQIILEPIKVHEKFSRIKLKDLIDDILQKVNLPIYIKDRYPHELSGGQRQRVAIARAIILNPKFIIADEPLSSLDVSIGNEIIKLLQNLQKKLNLSYLFISHDLAVVKYISDFCNVMYLGEFVEKAPTKSLFSNPYHPYTKALISSSYAIEKNETKVILKNELPSLLNPPKGCLFSTRCPIAEKICFEKRPLLKKINEDHLVACHLVNAKSSSLGSAKTTSSSL